jgi:lysozyme
LLASSIRKSQWGSDVDLVKLREGLRLHWYLDSLGHKTGGYGHLWVKGDPEKFNQEQALMWLVQDITKARTAANKQFAQLPYQTQNLLDVLVSVNYQLGGLWYKEHKKTWALLMAGKYPEAAAEAQNSNWYKQTPTRVKDLHAALKEAALLARQYEVI